jgi:hypothetical protein
MLEHADEEVLGGRAQVPGREALAEHEPGRGGIGREVLEGVAAVEPEADDEPSLLCEVVGEMREGRAALRSGEEGHHVARADLQVEPLALPVLVAEVELGEVLHLPARAGMVGAGDLDEMGIQIHPDDVVPDPGEVAAQPAAAAARVEDPGAALGHGVEQPRLPDDVLPRGLDAAPALGIAPRVLGVAAQRSGPEVLRRAGGGR